MYMTLVAYELTRPTIPTVHKHVAMQQDVTTYIWSDKVRTFCLTVM